MQSTDIIIAALNADLPYTEFVRQQIAGDVLAEQMVASRADPSLPLSPWVLMSCAVRPSVSVKKSVVSRPTDP